MSRPIGEPRICLRCGNVLPAECSISRRYCENCGKLMSMQLRLARQKREEQRKAAERELTQEEENRKYCKKCCYYGSEAYGGNLCDFMLTTGQRRGCKYGVGCEKRILKEGKA